MVRTGFLVGLDNRGACGSRPAHAPVLLGVLRVFVLVISLWGVGMIVPRRFHLCSASPRSGSSRPGTLKVVNPCIAS